MKKIVNYVRSHFSIFLSFFALAISIASLAYSFSSNPVEKLDKPVVHIESVSNPTYEDIVSLAKRGGDISYVSIFYSQIWKELTITPYSLTVEYKDDYSTKICVDNKKSMKELYDSLSECLIKSGRIK